MPEIKIKHVVSFSSEDQVHKSENLLKPETYRKWKCATPGEPKASIVLQFEKATQIHSIDIGNECSAFVEIFVGRSSYTVDDYQILLLASSFMSPLESRNVNHTNRVRMFGPEKLTQNLKDKKWDCVRIVCTQPFNKNIAYGLSFIKFHSPPEKLEEQPEKQLEPSKAEGPKTGVECLDPENFLKRLRETLKKHQGVERHVVLDPCNYGPKLTSPFPGSNIRFSNSPSSLRSPANPPQKRKVDSHDSLGPPPAKKDSSISHVNRIKVSYVDVLGENSSQESTSKEGAKEARHATSIKNSHGTNDPPNKNVTTFHKNASIVPAVNVRNPNSSKDSHGTAAGSPNAIKIGNVKNRLFDRIMRNVVFAISGFVNPLRSVIREKALEMGAKYKADWDSECTHLICAFENTPKYIQVQRAGGKIVTKDWVLNCHRTKCLLHWKKYKLGKYSRSSSSESETEDPTPRKQMTNVSTVNGSRGNESVNKPSTSRIVVSNASAATTLQSVQNGASSDSQSETEDEDALRDYKADTDVECDSGADTEDEIRKIENAAENDSPSLLMPSKPDTTNLSLPNLPGFFGGRHFYLLWCGEPNDLERYIVAYGGVVDDEIDGRTYYLITDSAWNERLQELEMKYDLKVVKSQWILKCHEEQRLVDREEFMIIQHN